MKFINRDTGGGLELINADISDDSIDANKDEIKELIGVIRKDRAKIHRHK